MIRLTVVVFTVFAMLVFCGVASAQEKQSQPPAVSPPPPSAPQDSASSTQQKTSETTSSKSKEQKQPSPSSGILQMVLLMVLIFGLFYVMLILPQKRRQKEHQQMISNLRKNDKVVTIGGIHGVVHSVRDDKIVLKVDENTKMTFSLSAIASVETHKGEESKEENDKK